jgi:hypothetical protein
MFEPSASTTPFMSPGLTVSTRDGFSRGGSV